MRLGYCDPELLATDFQTITVARFGGDEFVVMLSELGADKTTSREEAISVAEKIRASLSETYVLKFQQGEASGIFIEHNCSSSIGVVLFNGHEPSQEAIFKLADAAMYLAKECGRNLVHFKENDCPDSTSRRS